MKTQMILFYKLGKSIIARAFIPVMLATILLIGGCKKWLDLKPESEIILDEFWQNEAQVNAVLAGCYKSLTRDGCMSRILLWGEGRSDNVEFFDYDTRDQDFKRMVIFDLYETNGYCKWNSFYEVINYCNTFIKFAPDVVTRDPNFTEAKLMPMMAEVLTIRSLVYFYLVRSFKNVPWIDAPTENDQQDFSVPQSSENEVIAYIIRDLREALTFAPDLYAYKEYNKGRITKSAIRALLADVYLWNQQYENCIEMCNVIMDDPKFELYDAEMMLYNVFFRGNSTESIFELQFGEESENKQVNKMVNTYYGNYSDYSGWMSYSTFLLPGGIKSPFQYQVGVKYESLKTQDFRFYSFLFPISTSVLIPFKFSGAAVIESSASTNYSYVFRSNSPNWIVYRLSDIILMKAEALAYQNSSEENKKAIMRLVNTTYLRANPELGTDSLKLEDYTTIEAIQELVLRERQREFLFEGKRWYDLMRLARRAGSPGPLLPYVSPKFKDGGGLLIGSNSIIESLFLPVHKDELVANPKLEQNPYYKNLNSNTSGK